MALHPQAQITVNITSTRNRPHDPDRDVSLDTMDELGAGFMKARLEGPLAQMFAGDGTFEIDVTATHSLVEQQAAA